jgi:peptidoglycan hydrolase-like protein with peptidoglycan-binding domain
MKKSLIILSAIFSVFCLVSTVEAKELSFGSKGSDVALLQTFLIDQGFPIPAIENGAKKGYFGEQTQNAVMMYQESQGVETTGVIDSNSYRTPKLGAVTNPVNYERFFFQRGSTNGGVMSTSSTASTFTTTSKEFSATPSVILWTPNVNTTVSLSSTSTFPYVPNVGDTAVIYLLNASSTAGATITLAAVDTNLDLQFVEATGGDLVLAGLDWGQLTIIRQTTNKVSVLFNEFTEAD